MKLIKILLLFTMAGCYSANSNKEGQFRNYFEQNEYKKAIVISCIRCSCIIDELNELVLKREPALNDYVILGDTACLDKFLRKDRVRHIGQNKMDILSDDFYNILIFNKGKIRMVRTEESEQISEFLK